MLLNVDTRSQRPEQAAANVRQNISRYPAAILVSLAGRQSRVQFKPMARGDRTFPAILCRLDPNEIVWKFHAHEFESSCSYSQQTSDINNPEAGYRGSCALPRLYGRVVAHRELLASLTDGPSDGIHDVEEVRLTQEAEAELNVSSSTNGGSQ